MPLQIDITQAVLTKALNQRITSIKREQNKPGQNELIREILQKEINELNTAQASAKAVK